MKKDDFICAIRLTEQNAYSGDVHRKYSTSEIVDLHWEVAEREGFVSFTTNYPISETRSKNLKAVLLFSQTPSGERFIVSAKVVDLKVFSEQRICAVKESHQTEQWLNQPAKSWFMLTDFEQLDLDKVPPALCDRLYKQGFRRGYVVQNDIGSDLVA